MGPLQNISLALKPTGFSHVAGIAPAGSRVFCHVIWYRRALETLGAPHTLSPLPAALALLVVSSRRRFRMNLMHCASGEGGGGTRKPQQTACPYILCSGKGRERA